MDARKIALGGIGAVAVAIWLGLVGGGAYIIWHFISKFW